MKSFKTYLNESYEHFKKTIAKKAKAAKKSTKQLCNWFAGCTNPATGTTPHPILGPVHTCNRCHKFATGEDRSIKEGTQFDKPRKVIGGEAPKGTFAHDQKHKLGVHAIYKKKGGLRKAATKDSAARKHMIAKMQNEGYTDDSAMAHELIQHADNDSDLHRQSHQPIVANLKKKVKKGVYDSGKATKLWGYHADRAAQSYNKKNGDKYSPAWHKQFSPAVRKIAAAHWEAHHRDELKEVFTQEEIELIESTTEEQLNQMCEGFDERNKDYELQSVKKGNKHLIKIGKKVPYKKKEKPFRDAAVTGKARDFANEEIVNELSKKTLSSYYSKAIGKEDSESPKFNNRVRGTNTAVNKLTKIAKNEEVTNEAKKLKDTVGFLSPETHAKYAKEKKTIKQFASAKREINRLKRQGK